MGNKRISILGSTGSIGTQALDIIDLNKDMDVAALTGNRNVPLMLEQIKRFSPEMVCMYDSDAAMHLKELTAGKKIKITSGMEGLIEAAEWKDTDLVLSAVVGMVGIEPAIHAINAGRDIALANKETLVAAGHLIMPLAKEKGVAVIPVDSEHSAIFQCIRGNEDNAIKSIILTASGGPFRGYTKDRIKDVTIEMALSHPNWSMGKKVTIDSATMVNKGLEVMEARWLFDVDPDRIRVHVHPQSIVHSAVEFEDNAVMAQMGVPDMRVPISYALYYPKRRYALAGALDLFKAEHLDFYEPDLSVFKGLKLSYDAIKRGGNMPCILNIANERAVELFLNKKIGFTDIPGIIEDAMDHFPYSSDPSLKEILEIKDKVTEYINDLQE